MHILRYADPSGAVRVGVSKDGTVFPLAVWSLGELLGRPLDAIRDVAESADGVGVALGDVVVLPPTDGVMEVWAAGVTYARSEEARSASDPLTDFYAAVYEAERPELFFKSVAWKVVTDGEPLVIRRDSTGNIPEAEVAVVANAAGEIVGYVASNDAGSRSIEAENPLYLPQAKIYTGSCALSGMIRPAWEVDLPTLPISIDVVRDGGSVFSGSSSAGQLHRTTADLIRYLYAEQDFPAGAVLTTGTGVIPGPEFSLAVGDVVTVIVGEVGSLTNHVVEGNDALSWLVAAIDDPSQRHRVAPR